MKILFTILILFTYLLTVNAQQPTIQWQKCYGGSSTDKPGYAQNMVINDDGSITVAGYSNSTNGLVTGNHGVYDFWVIKLGDAGTLLWQKSLGGFGTEKGYSLIHTNGSGYLVAGEASSNNSGNVGTNHGASDFWLAQLDSNGQLGWQKCYGGNGSDVAYSVRQTTDGGYVAVGSTLSNNNGDVGTTHGSYDIWVIKTDASGILLWQSCLGGSSFDIAYDVLPTNDHGMLVAGYTSSTNGDVSFNHGGEDCWVVKLDSLGNKTWQKTFGGNDDERIWSIQSTMDGNYIFAAQTASNNNGDVGANHGDYDYWLVKIDGSGNILWENCFGGSLAERASSVIECNDGGFLLCGHADSNNSGDVSGSNGETDYWIVKSDPVGTLQWQKCLGGSFDDYGLQASLLSNGGYIVSGNSQSQNTGDVGVGYGSYDFWLVQLNPSCTLPSISISAAGVTNFCSGEKVKLTASTQANYQWQKNGTIISGATKKSYTAKDPGTYVCTTIDECGIGTSNGITVTVNNLPLAKITPGGIKNICANQLPFTLSASYAVSQTYQWLLNDNAISGATGLTYAVLNEGSYKVVVTNTITGCSKVSKATVVNVTCRQDNTTAEEIAIYPNPNSGSFMLKFHTAEDLTMRITVVNSIGELVYTRLTNMISGTNEIPIAIENSKGGIYFLTLYSKEDFPQVFKIIVAAENE